MSPHSHPQPPDDQGDSLSVALHRLAYGGHGDRITIGQLLDALGDRAFGALMFVFAAPSILPVPPGVSTILGTPLMFLSVQLMLGLRPWLPSVVTRRSLTREDFQTLVRRLTPKLARAERLLRPRGRWLTRPPVENLLGLLCLVLAVILALPIPLGNTLPALAISLLALGLLERDGVWILAGIAASAVALSVISGVIYGLVQAVVLLLR